MKVLIIEDEAPASRRLRQMLQSAPVDIYVVGILESVAQSVEWLEGNGLPDLIFMDIQLADGLSFEIFSRTTVLPPVIFTTAYDEYALRAFKVNSIDYLLKPISQEDLDKSLEKYSRLKNHLSAATGTLVMPHSPPSFENLLRELQISKSYKSRLLVKIGEKMISLPMENISYFNSEDKLVYAITIEGKRYPLDYALDELENMLDPKDFFRLNRQFIAKINSIQSIHNYFNGKLKLFLNPATTKEVIVSREKATIFKQWLEV